MFPIKAILPIGTYTPDDYYGNGKKTSLPRPHPASFPPPPPPPHPPLSLTHTLRVAELQPSRTACAPSGCCKMPSCLMASAAGGAP